MEPRSLMPVKQYSRDGVPLLRVLVSVEDTQLRCVLTGSQAFVARALALLRHEE